MFNCVQRKPHGTFFNSAFPGTGTANPPDFAPSPWPSQRTADQPLGTGGTRSPFEDCDGMMGDTDDWFLAHLIFCGPKT